MVYGYGFVYSLTRYIFSSTLLLNFVIFYAPTLPAFFSIVFSSLECGFLHIKPESAYRGITIHVITIVETRSVSGLPPIT